MKKFAAILISALILIPTITPASAGGPCNFNGCYGGGYHHHHRGGGGGDWAGPLVGGLIIGGIIGSMAAQPRYEQPYYPQTYCRWVSVYDTWGNYVGQQRRCWQQ